jgi:hypothetical protein
MERVLGIGGVFFRAKDNRALAVWFREGNRFELWEPRR